MPDTPNTANTSTDATPLASEQITQQAACDLLLDLLGHGAQSGTNVRVVEDHLRQHARRILTALSASPAPVGWKLVPIEPTQAQHSAGNRAQDDADQTDARKIYTAMLAASPAPSGQGVSGEVPTGEQIARAIKATEYKYFGDYEMSDDQRDAVDVLVRVAQHHALAAPAPSCAPGGVERVVVDLLTKRAEYFERTSRGHYSREDAARSYRATIKDVRKALAALSPQGLDAKEGGE